MVVWRVRELAFDLSMPSGDCALQKYFRIIYDTSIYPGAENPAISLINSQSQISTNKTMKKQITYLHLRVTITVE